ncbi:MAG TPA: tryptophan--tRNA ligase [Nitrospirota bacterium]
MSKRVLSGMRPTGKMQLGNLLGAVENWKNLQEEYDAYFFIADWHALTTNYADTGELRSMRRELLVDLLASGLDPAKCTIFEQSKILEHAELFVYLSMITPVSWLERNPTYKEMMDNITDKDLTNFGFLGYPVLMAADILMYKAARVPVGVDQLPHLELTREIARRFNQTYKPVFPEPMALMTETPKVPGIDGRKMSKSYGNAIYLSDTPDEMRKKIKVTVTDPARIKRTDPGDPDLCTAFVFHNIYTPKEEIPMIVRQCKEAAIGCVDCKTKLANYMLEQLEPIHARRAELLARPDYLEDVLRAGNEKARATARATMAEVRDAIGI